MTSEPPWLYPEPPATLGSYPLPAEPEAGTDKKEGGVARPVMAPQRPRKVLSNPIIPFPPVRSAYTRL
jgi:hypothetical protein